MGEGKRPLIARYTLIVTSCNRHDLLRTTLESFLETCDETPLETVIVEDSDAPIPDWWHELKPRLGYQATWLDNKARMGQIYACDRVMQWAVKNAKTDYVFWCEDDWRFSRNGFMEKSFDLLSKHPEIITVSLRGTDWNHPLVRDERFDCAIAKPYWLDVWGGFMFNPGLRRISDYKRIGSYGRHVSYNSHGLAHEQQLSKKLLDAGYRIAALPGDHCHHIGGGRSRSVEPLPDKHKILIAVPTCQNLKYGRWESAESPHYDRTHEAYGKDIHVSGENARVDAVRRTWWKDVEPFKAHVDARFFYGGGHPVRDPAAVELDDEVFLNCPDDYGHLPHKTQAVCKWAYEHGYQYLVKLDDDCFAWIDRLVGEGINARFDYAGNPHCNLCLGGAGYWLSRRAMKIIADAGTPDHWAEDMWVGLILARAGITAERLPHFTGCAAHYFDLENIPDDASVIHAVKPEDMHKPYAHLGTLSKI